MPTFDIVKECPVHDSYRTQRVGTDYDLKVPKVTERFKGDMQFPDDWSIGLIVGNSGTGKSTIAKELFGDCIVENYDYGDDSVLDEMPSNAKVDDIFKTFYAVGFGSVPSWLKPYHVLSMGEKMRVDMARALLEDRDMIVFDEFTSVVDRNVAKNMCIAVQKAIKNSGKKFVAVSCHRDITEYLQPDWVFDTDSMMSDFPLARAPQRPSKSGSAGEKNGKSLGNITI